MNEVRTLEPWVGAPGSAVDRVWYVSYGSNMRLARFLAYVRGGRAEGGALEHPGCRDPEPPRAWAALELRGRLYFATESLIWGGGRAFLEPPDEAGGGRTGPGDSGTDPGAGRADLDDGRPGLGAGRIAVSTARIAVGTGRVFARAYDVSREQFADVAAQEMYRAPGDGPGLETVLAGGERAVRCGPGRYETLLCLGALDGRPALTFTAPWRAADVAPNPPSERYLAQLAGGLGEAGAWSAAVIRAYLAAAAAV
ncbi:histone deacetylase [Streptomyces sp. Tu6071]|uniref:histone deacetylase n=1 Tax=Streptomyces sp. Tu6071 TaxID=355249 RepID=UPI0018F87D1F|nr:histone deacetylase [Streptomyces sp. Tu6071]